jgi:hypothetical protein
MRKKHGPEWYIQKDVIEYLKDRSWLVEVMHGNAFQKGIPDLYVFNRLKGGERWIDCKNPKQWSFTKAQRRKWPIWDHFGVGIWIVTAATQEEYDKLFAPPNWKEYWKDSWAMPTLSDIDAMLLELDAEYDDDEEEAV